MSKTILEKKCEMCGTVVKQYKWKTERPYKFLFINITQNPSTHYFCSKTCKSQWILEPNRRP